MLLILAGYAVIILEFTVGGFDILADFVGYFLLNAGMKKYPEAVSFTKARPWVTAMTLISFIPLVGANYLPDVVILPLNLIGAILFLFIAYLTAKGVEELEQDRNGYLKSDKLKGAWRLMLIFTASAQVCAFFSGTVFEVLSMMFSMTSLIANVIFLFHLISVHEGMTIADKDRAK